MLHLFVISRIRDREIWLNSRVLVFRVLSALLNSRVLDFPNWSVYHACRSAWNPIAIIVIIVSHVCELQLLAKLNACRGDENLLLARSQPYYDLEHVD
jgi:hypothetical protein